MEFYLYTVSLLLKPLKYPKRLKKMPGFGNLNSRLQKIMTYFLTGEIFPIQFTWSGLYWGPGCPYRCEKFILFDIFVHMYRMEYHRMEYHNDPKFSERQV